MINRFSQSVILGVAAATLGCGGGESTGVEELAGCTGPVSLSVSTGLTPKISWSPACKVYYLDVGVEGTNEEIWAIANAEGKNTISPGVTFGILPPLTARIEGPVGLQTGRTYYVFVAFYDNGAEKDGGRITFTP